MPLIEEFSAYLADDQKAGKLFKVRLVELGGAGGGIRVVGQVGAELLDQGHYLHTRILTVPRARNTCMNLYGW